MVGYKPSYGLISRNGVLRTSNSLDHIGMFARSVEDVALLAKVLIKKDPYDPATVYFSAENILTPIISASKAFVTNIPDSIKNSCCVFFSFGFLFIDFKCKTF